MGGNIEIQVPCRSHGLLWYNLETTGRKDEQGIDAEISEMSDNFTLDKHRDLLLVVMAYHYFNLSWMI
jgi:hypothetical protein